ncbi:hypothetical protein JCM8097_005456 [Rhodosporidiobolus ruineniae]
MSAVAWIVQQRHPDLVPNPTFYMDDQFGVDLSGRRVVVWHDREARAVPAAQAATVAVWDEIGLRWKWRKAEDGRVLLITGIVVDLDAGTLSLSRPPPSPASPPPPWARPLLQPVFTKLGCGTSPYSAVFINDDVREALTGFVDELEGGEPLSMADPFLTDWEPSDADLVLYTNACLETSAKGGSGLGFWHFEGGVKGGRWLGFAARPRRRYSNIGYAESLAVACAVEHALSLSPRPRRVLVCTDSATAAYAFDAGRSRRKDISSLVLRTYRLLRAAKVDLRVRHIRGVQNVAADHLSRAPTRSLVAEYGGAFRPFLPPPALVRQAQKR